MCGITGWISYDRDLTGEQTAIDAMTQTMACRGPDAGGTWLAGHAALGHRRLAVIDLPGGVQPMTATADGRTEAVLSYSGEVYNHRELRAELRSRGHVFRTRSDTEVVLRAYLEWGAGCAERLNGMYAFAAWDPRTQELLLVRDRMGIKPLYCYPTPDGVLFGSEPKAILAHQAVPAIVDAEGLAELVSFTKTPGHAAYQGMYEVRPGHTVRVRRTGVSAHRYWGLEADDHTDDLPTTVGRVRELLIDIVARQLVADVPLCTLLSGGLDSSTLTALAAGQLAAAGRGPVRSFAVDFAGHAEHFRASDLRPTPDGPYAHALADHVGADHRDIVLDTAALMDRDHRARVLGARDTPDGFGDADTSLYLLFKAVREHSTVALSGESADEVFGGYGWFHQPHTVRADTFPWSVVDLASSFVGGGRTARTALLDQSLVGKLDLAGYRAARYHDALAEVPHRDGDDPTERRMRELCYLGLTRFLQILLDRKDRTSMAVGLEVRVPFCDHRLVSYVFNTPWAMKTFDGREKSLLRAAAQDLLPRAVVDRVKSPYPATQDPRYARALRAELHRLAADRNAPVRPLLDERTLRAALTDPTGERLRASTELVLGIDAWLRRYDITLEL
ncbi:asparagine synthase (glutamine-hydrolyzing) [Streptomyces sp. 796.1]|uniref:asparagine synthase (glutamine-hydrolyzing) n=1 Tax=Streptomyces sp. 796.1 TaxID=3163029 RepID=UPI0039C98C59